MDPYNYFDESEQLEIKQNLENLLGKYKTSILDNLKQITSKKNGVCDWDDIEVSLKFCEV